MDMAAEPRWNFHAGGVACALITSFGVLISSFSTDAISQLNARNPQKTTKMKRRNHPHLSIASHYV